MVRRPPESHQWIRTSGQFDAVIDFARRRVIPRIHLTFSEGGLIAGTLTPSDGGYKIMGGAVDLKLFAK